MPWQDEPKSLECRSRGTVPTVNRECLAVREGFEPSIRFHVYTRSRRAPSTTRPPHHAPASPKRRLHMRCGDVMQAARDRRTLPIRQGRRDPAATDRGRQTSLFHGEREPLDAATDAHPRRSERWRRSPMRRASPRSTPSRHASPGPPTIDDARVGDAGVDLEWADEAFRSRLAEFGRTRMSRTSRPDRAVPGRALVADDLTRPASSSHRASRR